MSETCWITLLSMQYTIVIMLSCKPDKFTSACAGFREYRIRRNFRMAKFPKKVGCQPFQKPIFSKMEQGFS